MEVIGSGSVRDPLVSGVRGVNFGTPSPTFMDANFPSIYLPVRKPSVEISRSPISLLFPNLNSYYSSPIEASSVSSVRDSHSVQPAETHTRVGTVITNSPAVMVLNVVTLEVTPGQIISY